MKKIVLFDVDGTLFDSELGVILSMRWSLKNIGHEISLDELKPFVGPPFKESLAKRGIEGDLAEKCVKDYLYAYNNPVEDREPGFKIAEPFPGMFSLLKDLKDGGFLISTATTKAEKSALTQLKQFDIEKYFDGVFGAIYEENRITKAQVVKAALDYLNYDPNEDKVILVGDKLFDVEGAHANEIPVIAVDWGYAIGDELAEADYKVNDSDELKATLLKYFA